jgi:hypothetical protein
VGGCVGELLFFANENTTHVLEVTRVRYLCTRCGLHKLGAPNDF